MTEQEWLECTDAKVLLAGMPATSDRKLRLFAVACCRRLLPKMRRRAAARANADLGERFAEYVAWLGHGCFSGKLGQAGVRLARSLRRVSIASQIFGAISMPSSRAISWIPVGEVTLISVSQSPITSIPTKTSP